MCDYDSVSVYDGDSETDTLLGQWCGSEQPPSLTSKGNKLLVVLSTDRNYAFKGFMASYIGGECSLIIVCIQASNINDIRPLSTRSRHMGELCMYAVSHKNVETDLKYEYLFKKGI